MKRWVRNLLVSILLVFPAVFIAISYLEDVAESVEGPGGIAMAIYALSRQAIDLASRAGYSGIFVLMMLEAAAFPIPSEIILPLAGYLVSQGILEFWSVVAYSTVAALIGSFIDYFLGVKLGASLLAGQSKLPYVNATHLRRAQAWFDKYGPFAVALFRLVPAARVLISFPAGAYRMEKRKFAAYTLIGCLPWNITLVYLGLWLGSSWEAIPGAFRYINLVAYGFIGILVAWIGWKVTSKRTARQNH